MIFRTMFGSVQLKHLELKSLINNYIIFVQEEGGGEKRSKTAWELDGWPLSR